MGQAIGASCPLFYELILHAQIGFVQILRFARLVERPISFQSVNADGGRDLSWVPVSHSGDGEQHRADPFDHSPGTSPPQMMLRNAPRGNDWRIQPHVVSHGQGLTVEFPGVVVTGSFDGGMSFLAHELVCGL